jgi:hypothetical protein
MKYRQLIGCLQALHLARKQRKLKRGIFSYQRILWLHLGQCDGTLTTDSPKGIRQIQTFRKLAKQQPSQKTTVAQKI